MSRHNCDEDPTGFRRGGLDRPQLMTRGEGMRSNEFYLCTGSQVYGDIR